MGLCTPRVGECCVAPPNPHDPIGPCGCDRRHNPGFCATLLCPICTFFSYEGASVLFWISILCLMGIGSFLWPIVLFASCLWYPPLQGRDYDRSGALGGIIVVKAAPEYVHGPMEHSAPFGN